MDVSPLLPVRVVLGWVTVREVFARAKSRVLVCCLLQGVGYMSSNPYSRCPSLVKSCRAGDNRKEKGLD